MPLRYDLPFQPLASTAPAFNITLTTLGTSANVLQSTSIREWAGPSGRSVRLSETSGVDYRVQFGSSLVVAASTISMLILGGVVEVFSLQPDQTYIAIMTVSTQVSDVNVTLGYGR